MSTPSQTVSVTHLRLLLSLPPAKHNQPTSANDSSLNPNPYPSPYATHLQVDELPNDLGLVELIRHERQNVLIRDALLLVSKGLEAPGGNRSRSVGWSVARGRDGWNGRCRGFVKGGHGVACGTEGCLAEANGAGQRGSPCVGGPYTSHILSAFTVLSYPLLS